jgi:hypothetical protein
MPALKRTFTPEQIARGRFLYEQTFTPMDDIAGALNISRATLRSRVKEWGWTKRANDPYAARRGEPPQTAASGYPSLAEERIALVKRLQSAVNKELSALESMTPGTDSAAPSEGDKRARMLASLTRTLREMTRLEPPPAQAESIDDDTVPRDLDELRRELCRRLEALVAGQSGPVPGGP